jgi:hypothetical protein
VTDNNPYAGKTRAEIDAMLAAAGRAETGSHCAKVAIEKAKKVVQSPKYSAQRPRYTYRKGQAVGYAPAEGAIAYHEVPNEDGTLLTEATVELCPEKIITFATYSTERTAEDGYVDYVHEVYAVGMNGDIERFFAIAWPDGCMEFGDGSSVQNNDHRLALLRAKQEFERGGK